MHIFLYFLEEALPLVAILLGIPLLWFWLVRWLSRRSAAPVSRCPQCRALLAPTDKSCFECGWTPIASVVKTPRKQAEIDVGGMLDGLAYLEAEGLLDVDTAGRVRKALVAARTRPAKPAKDVTTAPPAQDPSQPVPTAKLVPKSEEAPVAPLAQPLSETSSKEASGPVPREVLQRMQSRPLEEAPSPVPRRSWGEWFAAFMEEKNIRVGELVGGLLIVGCSAALVTSFWSEIAARPLLKFSLFNVITGLLFAVGLYSHKKWKLPNTSRGILTIAMLLVPLNFLAIAAFTRESPPANLLAFAGEGASLAIFGGLVYVSARVLLPLGTVELTSGMLACAGGSLLARRVIRGDASPTLLMISVLVAVACYLGPLAAVLIRKHAWRETDEGEIGGFFTLLGLLSFAALPPLGLILAGSGDPASTLRLAAPMFGLCGLAPLAVGLKIRHGRLDKENTNPPLAATSVAVVGTLILWAGMFGSLPHPGRTFVAAVLDTAIFAGLAFAYRVPAALALAWSSATIGYVLLVHVLRGDFSWSTADAGVVVEALQSAATGIWLAPLTAVAAACGELLRRRRQHASARVTMWSALAMACLSLGLATWFGFARADDPAGLRWYYLAASGGALWLARVWGKQKTVWAASVLLLLGCLQGVIYAEFPHFDLGRHLVTALLWHGAGILAIVGASRTARKTWPSWWLRTLLLSAIVSSVVAAVGTLATGFVTQFSVTSGRCAVLALLWLGVALLGPQPLFFVGFQAALSIAIALAAIIPLQSTEWYLALNAPWLDPRVWLTVGLVWAGLHLFWTFVRVAWRHWGRSARERETGSTLQQMLFPAWPAVDQALAFAALGLLLICSLHATLPGLLQELGPRDVPRASDTITRSLDLLAPEWVDSARAAGGSRAWGLSGLLLVAFVIAQRERVTPSRLWGMGLATYAAVWLAAAWWTEQHAVASALRWGLTGFLVVASAILWARSSVREYATRWGWGKWDALPRNAARWFEPGTWLLYLVPLAAILLYVGLSAALRATVDAVTFEWLGILSVIFALAAFGWLATQWKTRPEVPADGSPGEAGNPRWIMRLMHTVFVLSALPPMTLVMWIVASSLRATPLLGPGEETFFAEIGNAASYGIPLAALTLVLVGYAWREGSSAYAFTAGLVTNLTGTVTFLLVLAAKKVPLDAGRWVQVGQINTLLAALAASIWLASRYRGRERRDSSAVDPWLATQVSLPMGLVALLLVPAAIVLFFDPASRPLLMAEAGSFIGWLCLVTVFAVWTWGGLDQRTTLSALAVAAVIGATGVMLGIHSWNSSQADWLARLVWLICWEMGGLTLLGTGWWLRSTNRNDGATSDSMPNWRQFLSGARLIPDITLGVTLLAWGCWLLTARLHARYIPSPMYVLPTVFGVAAIWAGLLVWSGRRGFGYLAAFSLNHAATATWIEYWARSSDSPLDFVAVNVLAMALPVWLWGTLAKQSQPADDASTGRWRLPGVQTPATYVALVVWTLAVGLDLMLDINAVPDDMHAGWGCAAALALGSALVALRWDGARGAVFGLYMWGLGVCVFFLDLLDLEPSDLEWAGVLVLAAYGVTTSTLWRKREALESFFERWLGRPPVQRESHWLIIMNLLLATAVTALATRIVLISEFPAARAAAVNAILSQALAVGLLAEGNRWPRLRDIALSFAALSAIALGWSGMPPGDPQTHLLHRATVALAALAVMLGIYGLALQKLIPRQTAWTAAARRLVLPLTFCSAGTVFFILGTELVYFLREQAVAMSPSAIGMVAISLGGIAIASLVCALLPGRDPFRLPEQSRTIYVYAAEGVIVLTLLHLRMTVPQWFGHPLVLRYWPFALLGLAYLGVGTAEILRRKQHRVLADPLENTGILLPLLPLVAFWFAPSQAHYSLILLAAGGLYAVLSLMRKSFGFGILATLAANGGLWYFLADKPGWLFADHPQLWIIPFAVSVLIAAYLHRDQLTPTQMTTLRYLCSAMIYVSSTADIVIHGVAHSPWLPLILAGLSLAGIFLGIALRAQAFLILGLAFLILALAAMIRHAQLNLGWTWLWYVAGIITGVLIIAVFAFFEQKRERMHELVDGFKQWDA